MSPSAASALTLDATRAHRRQVEATAAAIRERGSPLPRRALLLVPEVSGRPEGFSAETEWTGGDLPHFPEGGEKATTLAVGTLGETPLVVLDGGPALVDGASPRDVAFPVRMLAAAGVETMLFVNASGSLVSHIVPSDLVLLSDHINFQGTNPLVGPNVDDWGPRFPDMTEPYAASMRRVAQAAAARASTPLRQGVYFAALGPSAPTEAEARMARTLGGDVVGTSTVSQVIAARHMDVQVMAVSVVTRRLLPAAASGDPDPASILAAARPPLDRLLDATLSALASEEKSV